MLTLTRNLVAAWAPRFLYRLLTSANKIAEGYEKAISEKYLDTLRQNNIPVTGKFLVDIGSGNLTEHAGFLLKSGINHVTLCDLHTAKSKSTGPILNPPSGCETTTYLNPLEFQISIIANPIENLFSLEDNSVDLITSNSLLEHVRDLDRALDECRRVLKPGGYMLHFIDLRDHRNFNRPFTFLRYRSSHWERFLTSNQSYTNRFRKSDYLNAFKKANFSTIFSRDISANLSNEEYRELSLSDDFSSYEKVDLLVTELHLLVQAPARI